MIARNCLLAGAAAAALMTNAAAAQQTDIREQPTTTSATDDTAETRDADGLADIIVTATKEATDAQKISGAIATVSGDSLVRLGVTDTQSLSKLVGGLQVEGSGSIFIRGVGSRVLNPTGDPAVAFSVDGVYYGRPGGTTTTLFDLARVEVVKGPQGTLYGRNATGGALNVITNRPRLGVRSLDGQFEFGDYETARAQVAVNLPLGDNAALRLASQINYHGGYMNDGFDDQNVKALRASVMLEPSDALSVFVSADYSHQGGIGTASIPIGPGSKLNALKTRFINPSNPWTGPSDPRINAFVQLTSPPSAISSGPAGVFCAATPLGPPVAGTPALLSCGYPLGLPLITPRSYQDNDFYGGNVTIDADAGIGQLTLIGGYRGGNTDVLRQNDPSFNLNQAKTTQYSAEARLAAKPGSGPLNWIVGAFYLREKQDTYARVERNNAAISNPVATPGSPLPVTRCTGPLPGVPGQCLAQATILQTALDVISPDIVNETYAGFAQGTFSVTDWLRVIGGIRYTHELKSESGGVVRPIYSAPAGISISFPTAGEKKYSDTSYRAGVEIDVAPQSMFYAAYATAFHAGGFNLGVRQGPNLYEYQPEKVKYYVAGIKNRFFDNRLQLNVEGFWLDYNNYQQQEFGRINDGSTSCSQLLIVTACPFALRTANAATARVRGVEGDIVFAPGRYTTINLNILYNDAKFLNYRAPAPPPINLAIYDGRRIPGTTPWTLTGGINQAVPLGNGGRLVADVRSQYRAGAFLWFTNTPAVYQKAYTRTDLNLTYELPGNRISVTGFVRNVENKAIPVSGAPSDNITGAVFTGLNPPRTYGAIVGFHF